VNSRFEHATHLLKDRHNTGNRAKRIINQHRIGTAVIKRYRFGITFDEFQVKFAIRPSGWDLPELIFKAFCDP
jgi:hypothetical protein